MNPTQPTPINKFTIDQLPEALRGEVEILQAEAQAYKSTWGKAKLIASVIIAVAGVFGLLSIVFSSTFAPFYYAISTACVVGGLLFLKKLIVNQRERETQIKDLVECNKDLTSSVNPLFRTHLGRINIKEYSITEFLDVYRPFRELNKSVEKINTA